jgi:hypothetical protein
VSAMECEPGKARARLENGAVLQHWGARPPHSAIRNIRNVRNELGK